MTSLDCKTRTFSQSEINSSVIPQLVKTNTGPELPSRGALYGFCAPGLSPVAHGKQRASTLRSFSFFLSVALTSANRAEDHGDDDERNRVWAPSSAAVRPPCLRLNEFIWSDVSPPSVIWERMRLLVFVTLFGVLLDAGKAPSWRDCGRFSGSGEGTVWSRLRKRFPHIHAQRRGKYKYYHLYGLFA